MKKYYLEDMTYHFYNAEVSHSYINNCMAASYWDMPYKNSTTMTVRDGVKLETINNFIYEETLYNEAIANGYALTQEEIDKIDESVSSFINDMGNNENFRKEWLYPEFLKEVFKDTLASRFKQDVIDSFDIDDEAIKAEINYDEFRQYDIEYLYISTENTNEEDEFR